MHDERLDRAGCVPGGEAGASGSTRPSSRSRSSGSVASRRVHLEFGHWRDGVPYGQWRQPLPQHEPCARNASFGEHEEPGLGVERSPAHRRRPRLRARAATAGESRGRVPRREAMARSGSASGHRAAARRSPRPRRACSPGAPRRRSPNAHSGRVRSPYTSMTRSENPLTTAGWSPKPGADRTKPSTLIQRSTASSVANASTIRRNTSSAVARAAA